MKKIFILTAFVLASISSHAQDVFKKGDNLATAQIGIGSGMALSATYEKGIVDNLFDGNASIGVGGYLGYMHDKDNYTVMSDEYGWKYNNIILGVRGNLHYQFIDRLDTYAGLMLGYEIVSSKAYGDTHTDVSASASGFAFSVHAGTRYYFTDNFAAGIEVGYGIAYANIGIAYKF